jgi:hypothetical protein
MSESSSLTCVAKGAARGFFRCSTICSGTNTNRFTCSIIKSLPIVPIKTDVSKNGRKLSPFWTRHLRLFSTKFRLSTANFICLECGASFLDVFGLSLAVSNQTFNAHSLTKLRINRLQPQPPKPYVSDKNN